MKHENLIKIRPSSVYIIEGKWAQVARVESFDSSMETPSVIWKSSNPNIVYVDKYNGFMYGKEEGETTVYAISQNDNKIRDYCSVFVKKDAIPVTYITLDRMCLNLHKKETYHLKVNIYPENATNKKLKWFSSDKNIATVDNGVVYAKSQGTTKIMAVSEKDHQIAYCNLTVLGENPVISVKINPENKTMLLGESAYLEVEISPTNASNKQISWCSGKPSIVSVDSKSGQITANAAGNAIIYATSTDGTFKQAKSYITVKSNKKKEN